jgi:hypothetical protein
MLLAAGADPNLQNGKVSLLHRSKLDSDDILIPMMHYGFSTFQFCVATFSIPRNICEPCWRVVQILTYQMTVYGVAPRVFTARLVNRFC